MTASTMIEERTQRQTWFSVALGTALVTINFWAFLFAFITGSRANATPAMASAALGLALLPIVFGTIAIASGHDAPPLATVKALALALMIGLPALALAQDGLTGLVAGFGAGAALVMRPQTATSMRWRAAAVCAAALLTFIVAKVIVGLALATAPSLPLMSVALADHLRRGHLVAQ